MTDVVVLVPGITGSVLRDSRGRDLWAPTAGTAARALITLGRSVTELELRDEHADDGITAPMMIPDLHLIPGLWKIDGYSKMSAYLQRQFAVTPGKNFFAFPYDWRRDNRVAARQLKERTDRWLWDWRRESPDARLILVCHSMGGLVARYFVECLEGWRDTRRLVTFGTPFRGSLNALNFLIHGVKKGLGPIPVLDLSQLLRSFPSVYQLLPIYPCLDPGDGHLIRVSEAVLLPHVDADRARAADAFHREIEQAVTAHFDSEEYRRGGYTIDPIVGTFQPTLLSAQRVGGGVEFLRAYPGLVPDGDGTVPRVSATPIEFRHEYGAMFTAERHGSLQHNAAVLVQLAGLLSGQDTSRVRAGASAGLELDDMFGPGEPIAFRFRASDPMAPLNALVTDADTGAEVARLELGIAGDWCSSELAAPAPGTYRLTLAGEGVEPVTDTFVVVGEHDPMGTNVTTGERLRARGGEPGATLFGTSPWGSGTAFVAEERLLQARFPERIRLGEDASLLVRLGLQSAERLEAGLRPLGVPEAGLDVMLLLVEGPGFTLRSLERAIVHVVPQQDSNWAGFELQAVQEGVHTLRVEAFAGGTSLGGLAVQVSVDLTARTGSSTEHSSPVAVTGADPGEVSLLLSYDSDQSVYRYRLIDSSGYYAEEASSDRLLQPPGEPIEQLVAQLNVLARGQGAWDAAITTDWLKGQGITLWNSFIPQALQREFWQRRDRITQMTIVSQGDPVPWELLYPFVPGGQDAGFLIDQFPVARRRYGPRPPGRLQLGTADLVLGGGTSLAAVHTEVAALDGLLHSRGLAARRIGDLPSLLQAFQRGDVGLLHFSCHNAFTRGAPNVSRIWLGNQPFEPVFLEAYAGRFASSLVFLNACRTDGQAPLYTTIEGWAASFLRAGAGAFIGSLWEVADTSASTYAQEFYRAALGGATLGESARQARDAIRDNPGDPTWLAYTLYGDPAATVSTISGAGI